MSALCPLCGKDWDECEADRVASWESVPPRRRIPWRGVVSILAILALIGWGVLDVRSAEQSPRRWRSAPVLTWYGPGLYGNGMACGGILRRRTRGVAHRKLPCGTWIELRKGGRSVKARVVDRGPYPEIHGLPRWRYPLDAAPRTILQLAGDHRTLQDVKWRVLWRPDR